MVKVMFNLVKTKKYNNYSSNPTNKIGTVKTL